MTTSTQSTHTIRLPSRAPADRIDIEAFERMQREVGEMRRQVATLNAHTSERLAVQAKRMDILSRDMAERLTQIEARLEALETR